MRNISIANALFSSTRQRLLSALLLNPHQTIYAMELANHLGVRPSSLQRDLAKYTQAGILKMSRSGNRTYFQANEECPVFPELRALLVKTSGLVDLLHAELGPAGLRDQSGGGLWLDGQRHGKFRQRH